VKCEVGSMVPLLRPDGLRRACTVLSLVLSGLGGEYQMLQSLPSLHPPKPQAKEGDALRTALDAI
jgi:hypothetical protein